MFLRISKKELHMILEALGAKLPKLKVEVEEEKDEEKKSID